MRSNRLTTRSRAATRPTKQRFAHEHVLCRAAATDSPPATQFVTGWCEASSRPAADHAVLNLIPADHMPLDVDGNSTWICSVVPTCADKSIHQTSCMTRPWICTYDMLCGTFKPARLSVGQTVLGHQRGRREQHANVCCRDAIADQAGQDVLQHFYLRPDAAPATSPTPPLTPSPNPESNKPVILFRDTNAWCPHCQKIRCFAEAVPACSGHAAAACSALHRMAL